MGGGRVVGVSGTRLVAARLAAGLTQRDIGLMLGVTQSRVSSWERDEACPRAEQIPRLAYFLGLDALELLGVDPRSPSLTDLRLAAGLSRQALAEATGLTLPRYRRLERGSTRGAIEEGVVLKIAYLLAVPAGMVVEAIELARTH